jgi:hypothetical protein
VATFDAQYTLQSLIRTRTTGPDGNFNFGRISNAKLDALVDAMKTETDLAKRNALIREALVLTRDEVLTIPLHHQLRPWAMKKGITTVHRADDRPEARFTSVNPGGNSEQHRPPGRPVAKVHKGSQCGPLCVVGLVLDFELFARLAAGNRLLEPARALAVAGPGVAVFVAVANRRRPLPARLRCARLALALGCARGSAEQIRRRQAIVRNG